jgi:hypothetical protein
MRCPFPNTYRSRPTQTDSAVDASESPKGYFGVFGRYAFN